MFLTKSTAATFLALLPSALCLPQQNVKRSDLPSYCDPGRPFNFNNLWWGDGSDVCAAQNIAAHCCVTFTGSGVCAPPFDDASLRDLTLAIAQQSEKDGMLDSTTVGRWRASYATLGDHLAPPRVLTSWFKEIRDFASDPAKQAAVGNVGVIYLSSVREGMPTGMLAMYDC